MSEQPVINDVVNILSALANRAANTSQTDIVHADQIKLIDTESDITVSVQAPAQIDLLQQIKPVRTACVKYTTDDESFIFSIVGENPINASISGSTLSVSFLSETCTLTIQVATQILGEMISENVNLILIPVN